jgi:hypothetical protein
METGFCSWLSGERSRIVEQLGEPLSVPDIVTKSVGESLEELLVQDKTCKKVHREGFMRITTASN